jgi:hypothetical protein
MMFRFGDDDAVDHDTGDLHLSRIESAAFGDALDLHDNEAAAVARRHRDGQALQRERFALHRDVAVRVRRGASHDCDIDWQCLVEQELLAAHIHQGDEIVDSPRVELAATVPRINERAHADAREMPRTAPSDVAVKVGDDTLWQVVRLDAILDGELLQPRNQTPVAADRSADQAFMCQVIQASGLAITLTRGVQQGEPRWLAGFVREEQ